MDEAKFEQLMAKLGGTKAMGVPVNDDVPAKAPVVKARPTPTRRPEISATTPTIRERRAEAAKVTPTFASLTPKEQGEKRTRLWVRFCYIAAFLFLLAMSIRNYLIADPSSNAFSCMVLILTGLAIMVAAIGWTKSFFMGFVGFMVLSLAGLRYWILIVSH